MMNRRQFIGTAAGAALAAQMPRAFAAASYDLVIKNGLHGDVATSAVTLNSVRSLLAARPGLHTMNTLPMAGCAT